MMRAMLVLLVALPAAALAQREAPPSAAPDQMIAPAPCLDATRRMCTVPTESTLACDVCNPIVPGQPMTPELVKQAPAHQMTPLERTLKPKRHDVATRPTAPTM